MSAPLIRIAPAIDGSLSVKYTAAFPPFSQRAFNLAMFSFLLETFSLSTNLLSISAPKVSVIFFHTFLSTATEVGNILSLANCSVEGLFLIKAWILIALESSHNLSKSSVVKISLILLSTDAGVSTDVF